MMEGWGGIAQVPKVIGDLNLGVEIRYSAVNAGEEKFACFPALFRIIKEGEDMDAGGQIEAFPFLLPIPAGAAANILQVYRAPVIRNSNLEHADQVQLEYFYRETASVKDTFDDSVYIVAFLFYWTEEALMEW